MAIKKIERQNRDIFVATIIGMLIGLTHHIGFTDGLTLTQDNIIFMVIIALLYLTIGVSSADTVSALFNQVCITLGLIIYEILFSHYDIRLCETLKLLGVVPVMLIIFYALYKEITHNLVNGSAEIAFAVSSVLVLTLINEWVGLVASIFLLVIQAHIVNNSIVEY